MEWEMPYLAQKAMQARRVRRMEMVERDAAEAEYPFSLPPSEDDDMLALDGSDDVEAAVSLLSGGKSRYHRQAAASTTYVVPSGKEGEVEKEMHNVDDGEADRPSKCLSVLAASLCPCLLLGRATTLLTKEEVGREEETATYLNEEGWWACLSSCVLASLCPLPCLWPTLACMHRRGQSGRIRRQYPHFPSLTPSSSSFSSSSSSLSAVKSRGLRCVACSSLLPCPLVGEVSFLEEMKRRRRWRSKEERRREIERTEMMPTLSERLTVGKAEGKGKGRVVVPAAPKWEPFEGWDMRPIVDEAASAAATAAAVGGGSDGAAAEREGKEEIEKEVEKDVNIEL